jgi:hypothetical protein
LRLPSKKRKKEKKKKSEKKKIKSKGQIHCVCFFPSVRGGAL